MTSMSIDALDLRKNEMLMVAYSKTAKKWFACIGPDRGAQRAVGEGDTPIAAFAEMLINLGHRPDAMQ